MPFGPDPGVAVDRAEADHDEVAAVRVELAAARAAERLRQPVGRLPYAYALRAAHALVAGPRHDPVQRPERSAAALTPLAVAIAGSAERRRDLEGDRAAGTAAGQRVVGR